MSSDDVRPTDSGLFARPVADSHRTLGCPPVLESWNHKDHPDQVRLNAFLAEVEKATDCRTWQPADTYAIELVVGLPPGTPLTSGGRDLDNYLRPIARRVGESHLVAAFARKIHHPESTIAADPARPVADQTEAPNLTVRTSVSATSHAWKAEVQAACREVATHPLPQGPVALRLRFGVSRLRNWAELWKPAIDALGPILGLPDPARPFRPDDDRITDLELHRRIDDSLKWDVMVDAWWARVP